MVTEASPTPIARPLSERLASLWQTQRHWLLVLIPLALLTYRLYRGAWGTWINYDSPLIFQPFIPLLAAWLAWEKRGEIGQVYEETAFLYPENSPKRRGYIYLALVGAALLIAASLAVIIPLAALGFVLLIIGVIYYIYGPIMSRSLWQPLLLLVLMIPPPGALLNLFSSLLQGVTSHTVGPALHLFVPEVKTMGNYIFLPSTIFPIGPTLGGSSAALPTLALTLWYAFRKNINPLNIIILMLIGLLIALGFSLIRTFTIGLIAASDPELAHNLTRIPSWLISIIAFALVMWISRFFIVKPAVAFGEE